jgi:hypothetical protein
MLSLETLLGDRVRRKKQDKWRTMDVTHNYLQLPQETQYFLQERAFMSAEHAFDAPVLKLDEPYELPLHLQEEFQNDHVVSLYSHLVLPGESLPLIPDEGTQAPLLCWENWDERLHSLKLGGLQYATSQFTEAYTLLAFRDNPEIQVGSREIGVVSRWLVSMPEVCEYYGLPQGTEYVTVFYPGLGGLGYFIGANTRKGIRNYSHKTMQKLALESVRGTYLLGTPAVKPRANEAIIQAARIPGQVSPNSTSHHAFHDIYGFEVKDCGTEGKPARMYVKIGDGNGPISYSDKHDRLLEPIRSVWKDIYASPTTAVFNDPPEDLL